MDMKKEKHKTVYLDWIPVEVTYTPSGQTYEIYVDAIVRASALPAPKAVFNIQKTAEIASGEVVSQQSTFNIEKEAGVKADITYSLQITFNVDVTASINLVSQPYIEQFLSFEISLSLQHEISLGLRHATFEITMNLQHAEIGMGIIPMYQITLRVLKVSD
jgi:hypothetical protein